MKLKSSFTLLALSLLCAVLLSMAVFATTTQELPITTPQTAEQPAETQPSTVEPPLPETAPPPEPVPTPYTLSLTVSSGGSVAVNGEVMEGEELQILPGSTVTLSATASEYFAFSSWQGSNLISSPSSSQVSFVMPEENVSLRAEFRQIAFHLAVNGESNGYHAPGDSVTAIATPAVGKQFVEWVVESGGITVPQGTDTVFTFTMPSSDVSLSYLTENIIYYLEIRTQGNGSILVEGKQENENGQYEVFAGEELRLIATAETNSFFVMWSATGGAGFSEYIRETTVLSCPACDFIVTGQFATAVKNLTVTAPQNGSISPDAGVLSFGVGSELELVVTPNEGYVFDRWECTSQNGIFSNASSPETTFVMPDEDCSVTAIFRQNNYMITLHAENGGSVQGESGIYHMGDSFSVVAVPAEGYLFSHWEVSVPGLGVDLAKAELSFTIPSKNVEVTAHFKVDPGIVTVVEDPMEGFPWLSSILILLGAALWITGIVIRERLDHSYLGLFFRWLKKKIRH